MRDRGGTLSFSPCLPEGITRLAIALSVRHRRMRVEVTADATTYRLLASKPLLIAHYEDQATVTSDKPLVLPTRKAPLADPPVQPCSREPKRRSTR